MNQHPTTSQIDLRSGIRGNSRSGVHGQRSEYSRIPQRLWLAVLLVAGSFSLTGCSGAPDGKYEVRGNITWNGAPLKSGFISFTPLDSQHAAEAGEIHDGRFSFFARPGRNRVEIRATKEAGYNEAMRQPNFVQFLPAEYNVESKLIEEVVEGGENTYEIQLTGQEAK